MVEVRCLALLVSGVSLRSSTAGAGFPYVSDDAIWSPGMPAHATRKFNRPCLFRSPSKHSIQLVCVLNLAQLVDLLFGHMYNIPGLQIPLHGPVIMWCLLFVTLLMIVAMTVVLCQLFEYCCLVLPLESLGLSIHVHVPTEAANFSLKSDCFG